MTTVKQWYALYTRPHWEKKVAQQLTCKKFENYCPLNKVEHQWSDRRRIFLEPLFASYVFIYASVLDYVSIKQTEGVLNFVYWLDQPAVIQAEEINIIRSFLRDHSEVKLEKTKINLPEDVPAITSSLMSVTGNLMEMKSEMIKIELPSMGYTMIAAMEKSLVAFEMSAPVYQIYTANTYNSTFNNLKAGVSLRINRND